MKHRILSSLGLAVLASFLLVTPASAAVTTTDVFGSGANAFTMDFVDIGKPGNVNDNTGYGAVAYSYRMSTYEVSVDMVSKANAAGRLGITYTVRGANTPATSISWNEAARYVNWLNTSSGFSPAYKFSDIQPGDVRYLVNANILLWAPSDAGYNPANLFRNSYAKYFLPSENEWYKAAYYSGTGSTYYDFPTGSDAYPTAVTGGTAAGTAVYGLAASTGPSNITSAGGLSAYGTMGQGGNAREWTETDYDGTNDVATSSRVLRGSCWSDYVMTLASSSSRYVVNPQGEGAEFGFRVASVPEPTSVVLTLLASGMLVARRKR